MTSRFYLSSRQSNPNWSWNLMQGKGTNSTSLSLPQWGLNRSTTGLWMRPLPRLRCPPEYPLTFPPAQKSCPNSTSTGADYQPPAAALLCQHSGHLRDLHHVHNSHGLREGACVSPMGALDCALK